MVILTDHSVVNDSNEIIAKQFSIVNDNKPTQMSLMGRVFIDKNGSAYRITGIQNIRKGILNVEKVDPSCFKGQQIIRNGKQYTITNVIPSDNGMTFECDTSKEDK